MTIYRTNIYFRGTPEFVFHTTKKAAKQYIAKAKRECRERDIYDETPRPSDFSADIQQVNITTTRQGIVDAFNHYTSSLCVNEG